MTFVESQKNILMCLNPYIFEAEYELGWKWKVITFFIHLIFLRNSFADKRIKMLNIITGNEVLSAIYIVLFIKSTLGGVSRVINDIHRNEWLAASLSMTLQDI